MALKNSSLEQCCVTLRTMPCSQNRKEPTNRANVEPIIIELELDSSTSNLTLPEQTIELGETFASR